MITAGPGSWLFVPEELRTRWPTSVGTDPGRLPCVFAPGGFERRFGNRGRELPADLAKPADAEDAPGSSTRSPWSPGPPLVTLPDAAAIRDYLVGRQVPTEVAVAAARELPTPLHVTKRGALIVAGRDR